MNHHPSTSTPERIQLLAAAALRSPSDTIPVPRPVGFMLSFEQLRQLKSGFVPVNAEQVEAEAAAVDPRRVPVPVVEPLYSKGRHWRELMGGSAGLGNRRRVRRRQLVA